MIFVFQSLRCVFDEVLTRILHYVAEVFVLLPVAHRTFAFKLDIFQFQIGIKLADCDLYGIFGFLRAISDPPNMIYQILILST